MWTFMLLFWLVPVLLAAGLLWVLLARREGLRARSAVEGSARPLEVLKERYARGEISREEFERIKRDLLAD
jgi:putative membrane protein